MSGGLFRWSSRNRTVCPCYSITTVTLPRRTYPLHRLHINPTCTIYSEPRTLPSLPVARGRGYGGSQSKLAPSCPIAAP
ncbi:hypothetical protein VTO73DRAFT_3242 [Trametes versicolor]